MEPSGCKILRIENNLNTKGVLLTLSSLFRGFLHFDTRLIMKALLMGILALVGLTMASSLQSLPDTAVAEPLRLLLEVSC